jgi:terminase large subunit-like protein
MLWSNRLLAPWHSEAWRAEILRTLRTPQYLRLIENRWTASESTFIEMPVWDSCVNDDVRPVGGDKSMRVWVGMDLGWKHDSTALCVVTLDGNKIQLVAHVVFTPTKGGALGFESTADAAVRSIAQRFDLACVGYDPWEAVDMTQRLARSGINLVPIAQSPQNQTPMANQLIDVLKQGRMRMYQSRESRDPAAKTVVHESSRGLGKGKNSVRSTDYRARDGGAAGGPRRIVRQSLHGERFVHWRSDVRLAQPAERLRSADTALAAAELSTDGAPRGGGRPAGAAASWH